MSGRSYCAAVESQDCIAPAGFRGGGGHAAFPGVKRSELLTCDYCGEPVCAPCSDEHPPPAWQPRRRKPVRLCLSHSVEELAEWLGVR